MLNTKILGERILELRKQKGLTQADFAKVLNVSFQAVSNWERGIAPPDLENIIGIAKYFGVLVDDILSPKNEDMYLGIDGGGTKTEFVIASSNGSVYKRFVKSGCNPNDIGFSGMSSIIIDSIKEILLDFPTIKNVFCGIAGISTGDNAKLLLAELKKNFPKINSEIRNDSANLFALADNADMAVISGTGSVVFVKDGDAFRRLGGWGHLLDDGGSAYDIGKEAIREALRQEDMKEELSPMSKLLLKKLESSTVWERVGTIYSEGKPYIASLASVVFDAYESGDEKAFQIIDKTAKALANFLSAGVKLYGVKPVAIASGGIFEHYTKIMVSHIKKYTGVELLVNSLPPIYGACKNARRMQGENLPQDFYENFKKTYGGMKQ